MARAETQGSHRHGRSVIPARAVRSAAAEAPAGDAPAAKAPRVEVVREGGVVRAIDVTCACGERVRIVCDYGP